MRTTVAIGVAGGLLAACAAAAEPPAASRQAIVDAIGEGNWAEALDLAKLRLKTPDAEPYDLTAAATCLERLGRIHEADALLERAVERHAARPEMRLAVAERYARLPSYGYDIAGEFRRGEHRGGGRRLNVAEADRVRVISWLRGVIEDAEATDAQRARACKELAEAVFRQRSGSLSWRLQTLTDLASLPAPVEIGGGRWGSDSAASSDPPVNDDGTPVFYESPDTWDAAANDGERWRWAMAEAARLDEERREWADLTYASFLYQQFGVRTLAGRGWFRPMDDPGDEPDDLTSLAALRTLADDETIARLASGVRRFTLPPGHRFLELYERHDQWSTIAQIRLSRNQRGRAAEAHRRSLEAVDNERRREGIQRQIDQIVEPWALFEVQSPQPAGEGVSLRVRHRNTDRLLFTAREVDVPLLLADAKALWEASAEADQPPKRRVTIEQIGRQLLEEDGERYLSDDATRWEMDVERAEDHGDTLTVAELSLEAPGAYFVTARAAEDASPTSVVAWVADTVLVKKSMADGSLYLVLDARDGAPVADAKLEFFGYGFGKFRRPGKEERVTEYHTERFVLTAGKDGIVEVGPEGSAKKRSTNWIVTATTEDGRLAYHGFQQLWSRHYPEAMPDDPQTYLVTDRPAYRPGSTVNFKAWIGRASYESDVDEAASEYAHKAFQVELRDPRGDKVATKSITANLYGGLEGAFEVGDDALLGAYRITVAGFGGGRFRVEEYRKPEFEVAVEAPGEPVRLGEPFEATIRADYYFGAPVEGARVRYRVSRVRRAAHWIPIGRWDWLYGRGYGWLGQDAAWRSDWGRWGCVCPPPWLPFPQGPPELVAEGEAKLDADGEFALRVDTAEVAARRPDDDHEYTITAEVTDDSRRTIDGAGKVIVARRPLAATVALDRGHYEVGDTITATVSVRRPSGEPVAQAGRLRLLRIEPSPAADAPPESDAPTPLPDSVEQEAQAWDLASDADGSAEMRLKASEPGRYRLVFTSDPVKLGGVAQRVEAGAIFTIRGPGFDGAGFRFGALEIVPDKSEYQPGDTARLLVNTDRVDSTVALFLRPDAGAYTKPRVLRLDGKTQLVELPIATGDQPNFFVEALSVSDGRVHTATRQIVVPPAPRSLVVEVAPSSDAFLPGQEGALKVRLTDASGEPVVGEATIAVYDRAVDAVAPDVAPGDIRERFWSWRRYHRPATWHNLQSYERPVAPPDTPVMQSLGFSGGILDMAFGRGTVGSFGGGSIDSFADADVAMEAAPAALMTRAAAPDATKESTTVAVRTNFADTALWVGSVTTDADGFAEVPLRLPESLTSWRVRAWAVAGGLRVGQGEAECVTRKNLMVRLQAPRFLVESDEAVLSALVRSELPTPHSVRVRLDLDEADGIDLLGVAEQEIRLDPDSQQRVDWRVRARRESTAKLVAQAVAEPVDAEGEAPKATDAMRLTLPVAVHGAEVVQSQSATLAPDDRLATFEISVPERRRPEGTRLDVRFTPTLVGAMVDALPYLIDYPHGCTEQTLNRFLPAVVTRKTVADLGVDLAALEPVEGDEPGSPVFDPEELDRIVRVGVRKLLEMQLSDGGWGWFSGLGERSSAHTTSVVVRGLRLARQCGVEVPDDALDRGVAWLVRHRAEQLARLANCGDDGRPIDDDRPYKRVADNLDALVHLVLCEAGQWDASYRDRLFADRLGLTPYSQAMLGVALHLEAEATGAEAVAGLRDRVLRNLMQFVVEDDEVQTAFLNLPGGSWWNWYGSEFEAHAFFLKLLVATDADGELAPKVVKHLLDSRRSARRWNSTRDTALVVEALGEYAVATGEAGPGADAEPMRVEVWLDGQRRQTTELTAQQALRGGGVFALRGEELAAGRHTLEVRKPGDSRLYTGVTLANFSLEPDLRAAGLELRVERRLHRLDPVTDEADTVDARGGAVTIGTRGFRRVSVPNLGSVRSGELVEVELNVTSKNDYEYLVIEDPKPAGCEPVDTRSGYRGGGLRAYAEFRDRAVRFYAARMPRGEHTLRYRMRVETPGEFSALPTTVEAMYAPDLRGNSDELKLKVLEAPDG